MRAGLSKWCYRYKDDAGVNLLQVRVSEAKTIHVAGWEGLQDEVRRPGKSLEDILAVGCLDIQCDAPLARVEGKPQQALLRVRFIVIVRPDVPGRVATRSFYFDDIGSKVAE